MQLEILKLRVADELRAIARAHQCAVVDGPEWRTRPIHLPAGEVLAIEQADGLSPLRHTRRFKSGSPLPHPLPCSSVRPGEGPGESCSNQLALKHHVGFALLVFLGG